MPLLDRSKSVSIAADRQRSLLSTMNVAARVARIPHDSGSFALRKVDSHRDCDDLAGDAAILSVPIYIRFIYNLTARAGERAEPNY